MSLAPTENHQELERIHKSIKGKFKDKKLIFGSGFVGAKVVFVSEIPGPDEEREAKPLAGHAEKILYQVLKKAGIDKKKIYVTNVVKYSPASGKVLTSKEIKSHATFLKEELKTIAPQVVVTLGNVALNGVGLRQPLDNVHGRIFNFGSYSLIPTYHPKHAVGSPQIKTQMETDLSKLKDLLKKPIQN